MLLILLFSFQVLVEDTLFFDDDTSQLVKDVCNVHFLYDFDGILLL